MDKQKTIFAFLVGGLIGLTTVIGLRWAVMYRPKEPPTVNVKADELKAGLEETLKKLKEIEKAATPTTPQAELVSPDHSWQRGQKVEILDGEYAGKRGVIVGLNQGNGLFIVDYGDERLGQVDWYAEVTGQSLRAQ